MSVKPQYDVIVAGGGMTGGLLAAALATTSELSICVLESDRPAPFEPGSNPDYDIRVSALSIATERMFRGVGAWDGVVSRRVCPYRRMRVWDGEAGRADTHSSARVAAGTGAYEKDSRTGSGARSSAQREESFDSGACIKESRTGHGGGASADGGARTDRENSTSGTVFDAQDIGADVLGYIVENRVLQLALLDRLAQAERVTVECPARLASFRVTDDAVVVTLEDGRTLSAQLLVGADGAGSSVRRDAGIAHQRTRYEQHALVATIETARPQQSMTWQRFVPSGPQAFLPLLDSRASMVWYHEPDEIERLKALDDETFAREMEAAFPRELGGIVRVVERASFPIAKSHASTYVQERVALIGDAAHTVHPLAGQGVNLGMLDAACLAEVIVDAVAAGRDFGHARVLRRYERWRHGENTLMIAALDGFHHVFGDQPAPVRHLRRLALDIADRAGPLKRQVMRRAMGVAGDLPRLAR